MKQLARVYDRLVLALGVASGLAIAALAVLITTDVVIRNLGISNFPWLLEVSEYVLFGATFLAAPWVLRLNAHVGVDLLAVNLRGPARRALDGLANMLGAGISAILTWYAWRVLRDSYQRGDVIFKELVVPEWPFLALVVFAGTLLLVEFLIRLVRASDASAGHGVAER